MSRAVSRRLFVWPLMGVALVGASVSQSGRLPALRIPGMPEDAVPASNPVVSATASQPARPRVVAEGRVVAYPGAEVVVGSELGGRIVRLAVREKARVEAGEVIAELNGAELVAARAEARARIAEAEADIRYFTRELKREESLIGRNAGTRQNLDGQRRSLELAEAHRAIAQATVERLDAQLDKTIIRAPIAGVVTARHVDAGETIEAATPIVTIADLEQLRIEAEVDEYDTFRIALGAPVELTAEGHAGRWNARVEEIPDAVVARAMRPGDPGRPIDARVLLVKIAFVDAAPFKIGQRVEVAIDSSLVEQVADTIYTGGDIVTVNDQQPTAEALAVKDGKILAVGHRAAIEQAHKGAATHVVDLAGKALLPGFVDAHSHYFSSLTVANQVNVYAPPAGPGKDPASIVAELVKYRDAHKIPKGEVIQAYGYDENVMPNGVLLNRDDLDRAFPDNPVIVGHVSMHGGVLNSAALKKFNISAATQTPPGGIIVRKPGTEEPWGLIMETAWLPVFGALPKPTRAEEVAWSRAGQMLYAQAGITTAHEGATHADEIEVMKRATAGGANIIDIIAFPFITELDKVLEANPLDTWGKYDRHFKIGGVKITIDGSPQGKTAFFTKPYLNGGPGGEKDWRGELTFPEDTVKQMVKRVYDMGVPLNLHANGDAAIDTFLKAHEFAAAGDLGKDRRVTLIHAQFTRPDQLDKYVKYKVTPSFYTLHTFYFAEAHIANRGKEQAMYISPMRDAIDKGLRPTNHTDFVVAPLDQMFMMGTAVNRLSRAGAEIGPGQRVSPLEALKAITINVASQYGEEATKGTLEPGKLADLVILDRNPLTVDPMAIKDVKVVETIKEGVAVWTKRNPSP